MGLLGDDHTYSYSQLSSFDECSYAFYLQRIEGLEVEASNAFAERGSLIHDLLDLWAKKILTKEEMLDEYVRRYDLEVVTAWPSFPKGQAKKAYEKGIEFLENFDEFCGYEVLSAEEPFTIDLPLPDGTTRKFAGIVDMIMRSEETDALIVCDHKSKSMRSFKKDEDKMYRQQLLYSYYIKKKYGKYPDSMMFHLFNENGVKMERLFSLEDLNETTNWAATQIHKMEEYNVLDWLMCKEKPDYYCANICSARKMCPSGLVPLGSKKKEEYEGYNEG